MSVDLHVQVANSFVLIAAFNIKIWLLCLVPGLRPVLLVVTHLAVEASVDSVVVGQGVEEPGAVHAAEAVAVVPVALR